MSLMDLLVRLSGPAGQQLTALLNQSEINPDLAPLAQSLRLALEQELSVANFATVIAALPAEGKNIILGHLEPKDHSSDFA